MPVNQARRDLKEKLVFERYLLRKLNAFGRRMAKAMTKRFAQSGIIIDATDFQPELEEILFLHYKRVSKVFSNRLTETMPSNIAVTSEERKTINDALELFAMVQSGEQARLIIKTTQKDIERSFELAREAEAIDEQEQKAFTPLQIAVIAATNLIKRLSGRNETIAAYETQIMAETAKGTEGQVLSKQDPSVVSGTNRKSGVKKEWVTMGDEVVRPAHISADGQVVDINAPFIVGGEELMWPADMSRGASVGNTINCRCASVYDKETVYSERIESAELLESIQESL